MLFGAASLYYLREITIEPKVKVLRVAGIGKCLYFSHSDYLIAQEPEGLGHKFQQFLVTMLREVLLWNFI